ncbi:ABC transporter ATP-binding protein [Motilimonas sp. E26]|uniref:ABC transporter ATP-binding protein n=1 Tax=Motilimonas sp. E26 TaxID=2865674 RepID=UPI001E4E6991|nr:ABC transporter ATP-binding protein [Motilimonas sp. E26]MCE0558832.1 ABC transporter ATP-binding protein [Motilimonas sp. E26]
MSVNQANASVHDKTDIQLSVRNLCVDYITSNGDVRAVSNVSFDIGRGEVFGLAGESGCGKSTVAFSVCRLHKPPAFISGGEIIFNGRDILKFDDEQLREYRWKESAMVFQSAMNSLNPVLTLEEQFCDVLLAHTNMTRQECIKRAGQLLEVVDIHPSRLSDYPHQFSGGMRQRLVIAIALALNAKLIIMDEPTTALDVVVQREILQKIYQLKEEFGFSILFITHDISLMVEFCDRIGIMYAGELAEVAPAKNILTKPNHPYTEGLGNAFPPLHGEKKRLVGIPGTPLNLFEVPVGCRFQARCPYVKDICRKEYCKLTEVAPGEFSACHLHKDGIVDIIALEKQPVQG